MSLAAILLDYENLYLSLRGKYQEHDILFMNIIEAVISKIETGFDSTVVIRRSYLPFGDHEYASMANELALDGFVSMHVLAELSKNSADLMLAVDAIETVYTRPNIETFCIIGGDRDFIPVVAKLKELGKRCFVCSMPQSMSGDLLRFIGEKSFFDPTKLVECMLLAPSTIPKKADEKKKKKKSAIPKGIDKEEAERWEAFAHVAHEMRARYNNPELWLSPFINFLSDRFPELARKDIRETIIEMEKRNVWKRENKKSGRGDVDTFGVLIVNWNHPLIQQTNEDNDVEN